MDIVTYAIEHEIEENHWWFRGRRYLFQQLILKLNLPQDAAILDVGTSSGTNLRLLKDMGFTNYQGFDCSPESKRFCDEKNLGNVLIGDIEQEDLSADTYDLILATDVLEHLPKDIVALENMKRSLKPGGHLLITAPCFEGLWGPQDILSQHLRRYTLPLLSKLIEQIGLQSVRSFYFNFLLFLPIWLSRKILLKTQRIQNENTINSPLISAFLTLIFKIDCWSAQFIKPPFGVSCLIHAKKK